MQIVCFLCFTLCAVLGSTEDIKSMKTLLGSIDRKVTTIQDTLTGKDQATTKNGLIEVATGNTPYQSSLNGNFVASMAIDGNLNTFHHTLGERDPYLVVDLGKNYHVKRVDLYARIDCCGEQLHDIGVYIGASHNMMSLCGYFKGKAATRDHIIFYCKPSRYAKYIKIIINGYGARTVHEVNVYALQLNLMKFYKTRIEAE